MTDSRDFFIAGGTLRPDALCYVERQADRDLYENLLQRHFCYVLTARQMGKSSLMIRTAVRLRKAGIAVAVLDLTAVGQNLSPEQWYGGLLLQLGQRLALEDELFESWRNQHPGGRLQRWMRAIREVVLPRYPLGVVVFIDEIDSVRTLPFSVDEFFAGIRECYNQRSECRDMERLSFCLLGVAAPTELIRDTRTTPFNIGRRIELHDFTLDEAASFAPALGRDSTIGMHLLQRILYWTGGHPYLTQRLCLSVAEHKNITQPKGVDELCADLFFSSRAPERDDNLLFVRERMVRSEVELASLLDLYLRVEQGKPVPDEEANPLVSVLQLAGITRSENGFLKVRNRIYDRVFDWRWIDATMPQAELRRQRAAFRRGLWRAALIGSLIFVVLAGFAIAAFQQQQRAEREAKNYLKLLYLERMRLAQEQLDNANIDRVEELLDQTKPSPGQEDLRRFEWYMFWQLSHRQIWQVKEESPVAGLWLSADGKTMSLAKRALSGQTKDTEWILKSYDLTNRQELHSFHVPADLTWNLAAFSPDGQTVAVADRSAGSEATVSLWNIESGKRIVTIRGQQQQICWLAFSADGRALIITDWNGLVRVWDLTTGKERWHVRQEPGHIIYATTSPDGSLLATLTDNSHYIHLWNIRRRFEQKPITSREYRFSSVAFFPDGRRLLTASKDGSLQIWDTHFMQLLTCLSGHASYVTSIAFSPNGKLFATASYDRTTKIWSVSDGHAIETIKGHGSAVFAIAWSHDSKSVASSGEDTAVKLWNIAEPPAAEILGYEATAFNEQDELLALGISESAKGNRLKLWNLSAGRPVAELNEPAQKVMCALFSPDRKFLATAGTDSLVKFWDVSTGQALRQFAGPVGTIKGIALSADDRWLASGGDDRRLTLWDVATGEVRPLDQSNDNSWRVAFSPDSRYLAVAAQEGNVKLWDIEARRLVHTFHGHTNTVKAIGFSPDGKLMATGGTDRFLRLWDVATGEEKANFGLADYVQRAVFSPDGQRLVTGAVNGTVTLWAVDARQELLTLKGHSEEVTSITFSADGTSLATSAHDPVVQLWRADPRMIVSHH
ncbi:MAG TPA: AAA-like domain-containing protein [Candidatus Angelobacter sp.]|jgi:WD40 repeat protein|nr:AAA-like domain-containing protein [Candidatus Angelobacter sp.]